MSEEMCFEKEMFDLFSWHKKKPPTLSWQLFKGVERIFSITIFQTLVPHKYLMQFVLIPFLGMVSTKKKGKKKNHLPRSATVTEC